MATQTPNYNFDLREGTDIFNPLSSNSNWESLDTLLKTIQETSGITTYTTTASANLLKLSGTPVANDTVFKFVAAGNANTWTAASGGVINNIVGLNGVQMTIKGGNMYVAWINSANAMVCVVWPDVVNAQTFDGKGPDEWASKAQLDNVNQTAANATQTAQAAATVANQANTTAGQALAAAQAAGMSMTLVWTNPEPGATWSTYQNITLNSGYENAKFFIVQLRGYGTAISSTEPPSTIGIIMNLIGLQQWVMFYYTSTTHGGGGRYFRVVNDNTIYIESASLIGGRGSSDMYGIPIRIWAVK